MLAGMLLFLATACMLNASSNADTESPVEQNSTPSTLNEKTTTKTEEEFTASTNADTGSPVEENTTPCTLNETTTTNKEEEFTGKNIAKGKNAVQSSTFGSLKFLYMPQYAIDGKLYTFQHTDITEKYPWWRVDLETTYNILQVSVWSRPEFENRFHDVTITASDTDVKGLAKGTIFKPGQEFICADNIGSEKAIGPERTVFKCKPNVKGRYLTIQIVADCKSGRKDCNMPDDLKTTNYKNFLHMNEVEVVGQILSKDVAKGKPAEQSSTYGSEVASKANDGDVKTWSHSHVNELYPWWRVDLLTPHTIKSVNIFARPGQEQRFHDATIVVSNEDISKYPRTTPFIPSNDSICADKIASEKAVGPGWTNFDCYKSLVGRYVSVQLTADCKPKRKDCNSRYEAGKPHLKIVHMCEVQVIGFPDSAA